MACSAALRCAADRALSLTVDYYSIKINDTIALLSAQDILDACFNARGENPTYGLDDAGGNCAKIQRDPFTGGLSRVQTPYANVGKLRTSGWDTSINWSGAFADMGLPMAGRLSTGVQATRVMH